MTRYEFNRQAVLNRAEIRRERHERSPEGMRAAGLRSASAARQQTIGQTERMLAVIIESGGNDMSHDPAFIAQVSEPNRKRYEEQLSVISQYYGVLVDDLRNA
jgi:hypothetical protein